MRKYLFMLLLVLAMALLVACSNKEESARKMYNNALTLQQNKQFDEANKIFNEIVRKYPETQTAIEVNKGLLVKRRTEEYSKERAKEIYKEMFGQSLDAFREDNKRYPTTDEGLEFLLTNKSKLSTWDGPYLLRSEQINKFTYESDGSKYILTAK
ncbi:MAG: type II secretion system protein GspG [Nitrospirota bacterium]|nr:type II secretion system protein GspG [Nitrospirota bacterium]